MTRRKLCVVCLERPDEGKGWPRWCMKCSWLWNHARVEEDRAEWAARRARAFERRRWKAAAETMPVKVVRRNTCLDCSVTVPGRLPKGWYRGKDSGRPFTLCANCNGTAR